MTTVLDLVVYGFAIYGAKCLMVKFKLWDPFMIVMIKLLKGVKEEFKKASKEG